MAIINKLVAIADAIREKTHKASKLTLEQMPIEISQIYTDTSLRPLIDRTVTTVIFPNDLTKIGAYAFASCTEFSLATIPANIKEIGEYAFLDCRSLRNITFEGVPDLIASNIFSGCTNLRFISVAWPTTETHGEPWGAPNAIVMHRVGPIIG